jgi:hypothetical protein
MTPTYNTHPPQFNSTTAPQTVAGEATALSLPKAAEEEVGVEDLIDDVEVWYNPIFGMWKVAEQDEYSNHEKEGVLVSAKQRQSTESEPRSGGVEKANKYTECDRCRESTDVNTNIKQEE